MKRLDVVAMLDDMPEAHLAKGQVGTIVEELDRDTMLVEFADLDGRAYAITPIPMGRLIALRHAPSLAA